MYKKHKWINIISTLLALLSISEIILTIFLLLTLKDLIYFNKCQVTTICILIAGLFALPTAFKVKTIPSRSDFSSYHYYIHTYNIVTLYASILAQSIAASLILVNIAQSYSIPWNFGKSMVNYKQNITEKIYVDVVQLLLQCCGANSHTDWIHIDWSSSQYKNRIVEEDTLEEEDDEEEDISENTELQNWNKVPYSCCKLKSNNNCIHENLNLYGAESINTVGCGQKLLSFIFSLLITELIICLMSIAMMILLVRLMKFVEKADITEEFERLSFSDEEDTIYKYNWDNFANVAKNAEIRPSRHEEIILQETRNTNKYNDIKMKFP